MSSNTDNNVATISSSNIGFIVPDYPEEIKDFTFKDENDFQNNFKPLVATHGHFMCHNTRNNVISEDLIKYRAHKAVKTEYWTCDHAFKKRARKNVDDESSNIKRRKTKKASKKTECKAKFTKITFADDMIEVKYNWKHTGHDPTNDEIKTTNRSKLLVKYEDEQLNAQLEKVNQEYENSRRVLLNQIETALIVKEGDSKKDRIKKLEVVIHHMEDCICALQKARMPTILNSPSDK